MVHEIKKADLGLENKVTVFMGDNTDPTEQYLIKENVKELKKPVEESIVLEVYKDLATVRIEKSVIGKTRKGNPQYTYRVYVDFVYYGQHKTTSLSRKSLKSAMGYAKDIFISRNSRMKTGLQEG